MAIYRWKDIKMSTNLSNYGNLERLSIDSKVLSIMLEEQGSTFVIHKLADFFGSQVITWNLSHDEAIKLRDSLVNELTESINERI